MDEKIIKIAKKSLKKADNGSIKLKELANTVLTKLAKKHADAKLTTVKETIASSKKFVIDGKLVSLKRKKKHDEGGTTDKNGDGPVSNGDDGGSTRKNKKQKVDPADVSKTTSSSTTGLSDVGKWRKTHKIVLRDTHDDEKGQEKSKQLQQMKEYYPYSEFDSAGAVRNISNALLRQCTEGNGFERPSPIQAQCWPVLLENVNGHVRDVVGIAETGSGKTLAFAMPALSQMHKEDQSSNGRRNKPKRPPRMLVLAPTRELAMQSHDVLHEFGAVVNLRSLVVYGGVPKYTQTSELRRGAVDCVVATPGRLKDLINEGSCDLSQIQSLVLDEADRMLDMGFEEDVRFIISQCKSRDDGRQTAMFSATWPAAIQKIALDYMVDPVRIYVGFESIVGSNGEGGMDDSLSANKRVKQTVEVIEDRAREARLRQLLQKHHAKRNNRILIFALYKKEAERLEYNLQRDGWNCCSIHGNKNQMKRTEALSQFKDGSCPLMIATDVAARGLDIPNVEMVINFTFPLTIEDYVHRIGRTGRAGKTGLSHTFFQSGDKSHAGELQQVMRQAGQPVPEDLMKFGSTIKKKEHKLYGNFGPKDGPMKKATKITFDYSDEED